MSILKDVWGEIIKKISAITILAVALFAVPVMAQDLMGGQGVDILGTGIFECEGTAFRFPINQDTNIDNVIVGNDNAQAFGWSSSSSFLFGGFNSQNGPANAQNNLEIKKNQESGDCECCSAIDPTLPCDNCCKNVNIEQIKVGNRNAQAFGFASATNNVKIVTNQLGPTAVTAA